jgi:hypothetical protein
MEANRRNFLSLALMGVVLWCAPASVSAGEAAAGGEVTRLTLAVPGMT